MSTAAPATTASEMVTESTTLPAKNVAASSLPANPPAATEHLSSGTRFMNGDAIGLLETKGLACQFEAVDAMLKAANVSLVKQIQIGNAYITTVVRGDVGSVRAAVDAGQQAAAAAGEVISAHVIARPEPSLLQHFI